MLGRATKRKKKKRNYAPFIFFIIFLIIVGVIAAIYFKSEYNEIIEIKHETAKAATSMHEDEDLDSNFLKALIPSADSGVQVINVSSSNELPEYAYDESAGKYIKRIYKGRRINIALTGVDSRLGDRYKHADANHIISILLDSGKIEIISIPRDTPADAGYDDTTGQNKLTIVRAAKGRKAYFQELCRIGEVDKIHYFAELGFSQAIGIIEWLGFDKPNETLQILRSRSALGGDDFQRVYNQGQFIKQMLFRNLSRLDGVMGDIFIGSGLLFVESNLTSSNIKEILSELKAKNFSSSPDNIFVKIRPAFPAKFKLYDFSDKNTIASLSNLVKSYFSSKSKDETGKTDEPIGIKVYTRLRNVLDKAAADSSKKPQNVIRNLSVFFEQRAWLQIDEKEKRLEIRNDFVNLLTTAYEKRKDTSRADKVRLVAIAEDNLLKNKLQQTKSIQ